MLFVPVEINENGFFDNNYEPLWLHLGEIWQLRLVRITTSFIVVVSHLGGKQSEFFYTASTPMTKFCDYFSRVPRTVAWSSKFKIWEPEGLTETFL